MKGAGIQMKPTTSLVCTERWICPRFRSQTLSDGNNLKSARFGPVSYETLTLRATGLHTDAVLRLTMSWSSSSGRLLN